MLSQHQKNLKIEIIIQKINSGRNGLIYQLTLDDDNHEIEETVEMESGSYCGSSRL